MVKQKNRASMSHNTHILDGKNRDAEAFTREQYLEMAAGWEDAFGLPTVYNHEGINVVRDDLIGYGSKARFGALFVQTCPTDAIVYVAPRTGYAPVSLAELCKRYGKQLILFAPAAKEPSHHQLKALEAGAEMRFVKIAAMSVLNKYARDFAEANGHTFAPFGLAHPLVISAIVNTCERLTRTWGEPSEVWTVISTGVLARGLMIGWPNAKFHCVAVARNIKGGEAGRAAVYSSPHPFTKPLPAKDLPPWPSVPTYDAKLWPFLRERNPKPEDKVWVWNVAGEMSPAIIDPKTVKSQREWGDLSDIDLQKGFVVNVS
jgi:hypothetical protein